MTQQSYTSNTLLNIMLDAAKLRLSASEVLRKLLLAEDLNGRIGKKLEEAVERIIDDCINNDSYRRSIVNAVYGVVDATSELKDMPSDVTTHILEKIDPDDLKAQEDIIANRNASRILPLFYPEGYSSWRILHNLFTVRPRKMYIVESLQEAIASERDAHAARVERVTRVR